MVDQISNDPPQMEKERETRHPANKGPNALATLPPTPDSPLVVARRDAGTVRFVIIAKPAKQRQLNTLESPISIARTEYAGIR
mmetsp:Transcript_27579/g.41725  ORF Transcript_27579/g.41725 Transcript_27579/m.41725 type:complete len:83 (-) Transcript_27579:1189-1437(-)